MEILVYILDINLLSLFGFKGHSRERFKKVSRGCIAILIGSCMRFFHDLYAKLSDPSANLQGNDLQILLVAMET